ncbi:MAG TPA: hypothetical protein EYP04_06075, partial [Anaerolineae bacterium]|nr:hypothetical protein [Anaerolineae bacterium]
MIPVHFELGEPGARAGAARKDVVVVVDALRASVTTAAALAAGAVGVIPVFSVQDVLTYVSWDGYVAAGERDGRKLPECDFGNSPTELLVHAEALRGRTLVHITTNGTRCALAAVGATALFTGSLPNARSLTQTVFATARAAGVGITLVAAGVHNRPVEEDTLAVAWLGRELAALGAKLVNPPAVTLPTAEQLPGLFAATHDGRKLIGLGYAADVAYCARVDVLAVVPVFRNGAFVAANLATSNQQPGAT